MIDMIMQKSDVRSDQEIRTVYRELKDVWCSRCRPSNEIVLEARESDEILNVNE